MSIQSVSGSESASIAAWLESINSTNRTTTGASSSSTQTSATGDSSSISNLSQLYSQLASLATSDPAKFNAVAADVAAQLKSAADGTSGTEADTLKAMADRFSKASESGDVGDLRPAKGHGHHHHSHPQAASATDDSHKAAADLLTQILQKELASSSATTSSTTASASATSVSASTSVSA